MPFFKSNWIRLLTVALALGTAWAVRGQFGHEHGAAWAGAIGVLAVLVLANRPDWRQRLPAIVALGAIGWGVGGMMSYGVVVGYGRGVDWVNVSYGLSMLFVIGGLYGFIGGGLTGLTLESSESHKPVWASLVTQMVAGAYLIWGILIYQLEWLMTPPRSELWAACLGAALALGWYQYRNGFHRSFTTALYTALGAGFGFAFGNFLQVLGSTSGIDFNWWNVMEYSLGFFGGLGMAYAIFAQDWPESRLPDKVANTWGWIFLIALLPATNLVQQFNPEKFQAMAERFDLANSDLFVILEMGLAWGISLLAGVLLTLFFWSRISGATKGKTQHVRWLLMVYLAWYICLSNLLTAAWWGLGSLRDGLYWLNWLGILLLARYAVSTKTEFRTALLATPKVVRLMITSVLLLLLLSWVLIKSHDGMSGSQIRFSLWK